MNCVSELIGKPLLTRGGTRIGYIKNIRTDKAMARLRNLECCDAEEEEFVLPFSALAQVGADAAVVKNPAAVPCKDGLFAPLGRAVFSQDGDRLGVLVDLKRDGYRLTHLCLSDGRLVPAERLIGADDALLVDLSDSPVRRPARRSAPRPATPPKSVGPEAEEGTDTKEQAGPPATDRSSVRSAGSALLTGKVLPEDLLDARGNVLARRGRIVSAPIIRRALLHDKLFALTLLCTRP